MWSVLARGALALPLLAIGSLPASADFYGNVRTISMIVNFGPGSGPDGVGRLVARYLSGHLPGKPTIVVQNIAGAGGLNAQNVLGLNVGAKADGTTIGFFQVSTIAAITDDPAARVPIYDLHFFGGLSGQTVFYGRTDMQPGVSRAADVAKATMVYAGGYARTAPADVKFRLSLGVLGMPFRIITGFAGSASVTKAILQNEVNLGSATVPVYLRQIVPQLISAKVAIPLWYLPTLGPKGEAVSNPNLDSLGFQSFTEVYKQAYGKAPQGPLYDAMMVVNDASAQISQGLFAAGNIPPEAAREMQAAFEALQTDQDFIRDYRRFAGDVSPEEAAFLGPDFVSPEEAAQVFARIRATRPEVKEITRKVANGD